MDPEERMENQQANSSPTQPSTLRDSFRRLSSKISLSPRWRGQKSPARSSLLEAIDTSGKAQPDILKHDYTKAQHMALDEMQELRILKRLGHQVRTKTGESEVSESHVDHEARSKWVENRRRRSTHVLGTDEDNEFVPHRNVGRVSTTAATRSYFIRFIRRWKKRGRTSITSHTEPKSQIVLALVRFQLAVRTLSNHEDFELLVIVLILANCVTLAMYDPLMSDDSPWNGTLNKLDLAFNIMFTAEMFIRIISGGGILAYLKEPWNFFDGVMVLAGYTAFLPVGNETSGTSSIRALRALRALRPLRTITRFESLRSVVVCFLEALPLLVSVVGLLFFFLFLFAIAGIQMFIHVYHKACVHDETGLLEVAQGNSPDELGCGGSRSCPSDFTCTTFPEGTNIDVAGFDNIASSMLTVFQCTTLGGWSYVMYRVMDNTSYFSVIYFLLLILFGAYFVVNLFLAVLKTKFGKAQSLFRSRVQVPSQQRKNTVRKFLEWTKASWSEFAAKRLASASQMVGQFHRSRASFGPRMSIDLVHGFRFASSDEEHQSVVWWDAIKTKARRFRRRCKKLYIKMHLRVKRIVLQQYFSHFFLFCIIINTLLLALEFDGMPPKMEEVLQKANVTLTVLFTVEMILKLFGLGFWEYVSDRFNIFDSVIVMLALVELIFQIGGVASSSGSIGSLRVLKSFRVLRLFKMFRYLPSLRKIGEVLLSSFSSFMAIVLLMFIFMVVFAIVGLHVYGGVFPEDEFPNFNTFLNSIIVMFNVLTLEDWEIVMYSAMHHTNFGSVFYFVAWVVLGKYTFLTLFLAVTLEAFESKYDVEASSEAYIAYKENQSTAIKNHSQLLEESGDTDQPGGGQQSDQRVLAVFDEETTIPKTEFDSKEEQNSATDSDSDVEFGPDICRMLNIPGSRNNSKKHLGPVGEGLEDNGTDTGMSIEDEVAMLLGGDPNPRRSDDTNRIGTEASNGNGSGSRDFHLDAGFGDQGSMALPVFSTPPILSSKRFGGDMGYYATRADLTESDSLSLDWEAEDYAIPKEESARSEDNRSIEDTVTLTPSPNPYMEAVDNQNGEFSEEGTLTESPSPNDLTGGRKKKKKKEGARLAAQHRLPSASPSREEIFRRERGSIDMTPEDLEGCGVERILEEAQTAKEIHEVIFYGDSPVLELLQDDKEAGDGTEGNKTGETKELPPLEGNVLFIFKPTNPLRLFVYKIISTDVFDGIMFFFIICSCVAMAREHPRMEKYSTEWNVLLYLDVMFTAIFGIEFLLKTFALSFPVYIKTLTNKVDLAIVLSSILVLVLERTSASYVKGFRVLRAIKPLRALTRSAGMLLVFRSVTLSLAAMANVSIVCLLFFIIFAILGVQLFSGRFYRCNDVSVEGKYDCVGMFINASGQSVEREWTNPVFNFDHLGNALLALFVTVTLDGYNDILMDAMAVTDKDKQPSPLANPGGFFFFMAFIMLCAFCLLNLYVGVVFYQFSRIRLLSQTGSAFFTDDQQEWSELAKMVFRLKPITKAPMPKGMLRCLCYKIVIKKSFDYFITIVIIMNVIIMTATVYGESPTYEKGKEMCNIAFSIIFTIEAAMKIYAFTWRIYIKSGWNKFDFFLVVTSGIDMVFLLTAANFAKNLKIFRVQKLLRLLRISRMFKLVKGLKGVRSLFATLVISLPAFWNVGALLLLLFFVYAYMGVLFFGMVKRGRHLNDHANFEKFPTAMLTLFRIATNDEWKGVMEDCMVRPPNCDPGLGECGSGLAIPYFISFVLLISIIMLNLFTAVIIENFEKQQYQDQWRLHPSMLEEFVELWGEYDDGSTTIDPKQLEQLLCRLSPPLGLGPFAESQDVLRFVYDLDIPLVDGRVQFHRAIYELVRRCSETVMPQGEIKNQIDRLIEKFFVDLPLDSMLNFSSAVMVPRIERKWMARFHTTKMNRMKQARQARMEAVSYKDVCSKAGTFLMEFERMKKQGTNIWKIAPEAQEMLRKSNIKHTWTKTLQEWTSVMPFWSS